MGIKPSFTSLELPSKITDNTQVESGCKSSSVNRFVVSARGGLPQNPNELFSISTIQVNLLDLVDEGKIQSNNSSQSNSINYDNPKKLIVEATGFIRNNKGEIELVALENSPLKTKHIIDCSGKHG